MLDFHVCGESESFIKLRNVQYTVLCIDLMFRIRLLWWLKGEESTCNAGDVAGAMDSAPGSGRSPGGGNGNLVQYSCLKNLVDRRDWRVTVLGAAEESDMT